MTDNLLADATKLRDQIIADRRDFHAYPELAYTEERTAQKVSERLTQLGIPHQTGIGETGVVGLIKGGRPGKTVLLRADMDALPITEVSAEPYVSQNSGVMHACGHDGHTAMLLAASRILYERRESLTGNVKLMFQPAEEGGAGAQKMIDAGLLDDPKVDGAFGIHLGSNYYSGKAGARSGPMMASADHLKVTVRGLGGHAAQPHLAVDPVVVASHIVVALQTLISREVAPTQPAVITIGKIEAGTTFNVIPGSAQMLGTIRTYSASVQDRLERRIHELVSGIASAMRAEAEVEYTRLYPPLVNHEAESALMNEAIGAALGADAVMAMEQIMGAEDFSFVLQNVPGAFAFVGIRKPEWETPRSNHNASFDMDEDVLPKGAAILVSTALRFLEQ